MKNRGISLITLIITIVVIIILAATIILSLSNNNIVGNADNAVLENDISVMQDVLNLELSDITLNEREIPVLYTDESYTEKVTDRVWINPESDNIGKVYYKTSKKKFCIIFGKEGQAKIDEGIEVATVANVGIDEIVYRYTNQELATHKGMKLNWYVTYDNKILLEQGGQTNEAGIYKMTVNAGAEADWIGLEVNNLVVPEGANIEYSFETSNDLVTWDTEVDNINDAVNSQYLRIKLNLIPNEKGECPSLTSIRVIFNVNGDIIEQPIYGDKYKEVYFQGQKMYLSIDAGAGISQVVKLKDKENESGSVSEIRIPIVHKGNVEYLTPSEPSISGVADLNVYGSSNGIDWEKIEEPSGYEYVKVEVVARKPDVMVGEVQVNTTSKVAEAEWITTKTEYYEAYAEGVGEWVSIETDEEIPEGTRIIYSFAKSNDGKNWTNYSKYISENGNSSYIKVKVEFQRLNENGNKNAKLNELVINYNINGVAKKTYLASKGIKPPVDILYTVNETVLNITTEVENKDEIIGVQYKINDSGWTEKIYQVDEPLIFDAAGATSVWVAVRSVALDEKTVSNPIQKTIELEGLVQFLAQPAKDWINGNVKVAMGYSANKDGYVLQYKIGSNSWQEYEDVLEIEENTTIVGRMYNKEEKDEIAVNSISISNIDKTPPTVPTTFTYKVKNSQVLVSSGGSTDSHSGIAGYQYKLGDGEWSETQPEDTTYTFTDRIIAGQTYEVYARAIDKVGLVSEVRTGDNTISIKPTLHVAVNGDDSTADGSEEHPYATVAAALEAAVDGNAIHIGEGEFTLSSIDYDSYGSIGIYDYGKSLEIYGENEKTILTYNAIDNGKRDGATVTFSNKNSILRNLTYIYYPKSGDNYSRAIFRTCQGTIENVFFRISGSNAASYLYYNDQSTPTNINNCTFFHDLEVADSNYSGKANFTNIATNVNTNGTNTNVINIYRYARVDFAIAQIIQVSKDNEEFNANKVGVFYGENAWDDYENIDFKYNPSDYIIHVSKSGNDETGNGSEDNPYATLNKALEVLINGDRIYIHEGEYILNPIETDANTAVGVYDYGKEVEIYGENEKTILIYNGIDNKKRDGAAVTLGNSKSTLRNLTYIYHPKSGERYSRAIFKSCEGSIENVFFRISGNNAASYISYDKQETTTNIKNCTFFHDTVEVLANYGGKVNFINIATNVNTNGTNTNVITHNRFARLYFTTTEMIQASKDNVDFNVNQVGVFHGDNAWDNYVDIDFSYDPEKYVINVSNDGNNETGNGTEEYPYATVDKALNVSLDGDKIYIHAGEYVLNSIKKASSAVGIYDYGKKLEIYGENEKTILSYTGIDNGQRDGATVTFSNKNSILRNLTYVYYPKSGSNYNRSIFRDCFGNIENVFFRISGNNSASYLYHNSQSVPTNIINCTFFHETGSVLSNYSGKANFTNIATNVNTNGTNTNVITEDFGTSNMSLIELIEASKNNNSFNTNQVGVFYGDYAWK